jgi:hypothetical protein
VLSLVNGIGLCDPSPPALSVGAAAVGVLGLGNPSKDLIGYNLGPISDG